MTTINSNFRAQVGDPIDISGLGPDAVPPELAGDPAQAAEELKMQLTDALAQLDAFRDENAQWLSDENLAEMNRIEAMMKAESAAIDAYGVGGAAGGTDAASGEVMPQNLEPLWNGVPQNGINQFDEDRNRLSADPERFGEYVASIEIANTGSIANPSQTAFQMTEDMTALRGESIGRDIVLTAEYQDGTKRSWVIKNGTMRAEPITISAMGLSHSVTIDMRHVIRVSNGTDPAANMLYFQNIYIWGSEFNDTIYGSEGRDKIAGMAGDDTIHGMAGVDTIRGMAGNDTISGGAGEDILFGGADFDTSFKSDEGDTVNEFERGPIDDVVTDLPPSASVFQSTTWTLSDEQEPGVMVIENNTDRAGTIDVNMPDGYNMAYAERDAANALIITFVGDNGTFKLKIKNFFSEFDAATAAGRIARLNFHGGAGNDIIDFSRVGMLSHQVINITDEEGGDDIILGAENEFVANGGNVEDMLRSQGNGRGELDRRISEGLFAPPDRENLTEEEAAHPESYGGYRAEVNGNGQIEIRGDGLDGARDDVLRIEAPDGYEMGYITQDASGNYYVILMSPGTDGERADTIVIKVRASLGLDMDQIWVGNRPASGLTDDEDDPNFTMNWFELTPISSNADDYSIDAGDGHDLIFAQKGSRIENTDGDDVVERESETQATSTDLSPAEETNRTSGDADRAEGSDDREGEDGEGDEGDEDTSGD